MDIPSIFKLCSTNTNTEEKMEALQIGKRGKKGLWKPEEDMILKQYVETHGEGNWPTVSLQSGLKRGGKSCRLRWKNYLRPDIKRGSMSKEEEDLIIRMHKLLGNRWSLIAGRLPGRTDNEVKNYWNTHLNKRSHLGKRKNLELSDHLNFKLDDHESKLKKKKKKLVTGVPTPAEPSSPLHQTTGNRNWLDREDSMVTSRWTEDGDLINDYGPLGSYSLIPINNSSFVSDDELLVPYLDSFVWFESSGLQM